MTCNKHKFHTVPLLATNDTELEAPTLAHAPSMYKHWRTLDIRWTTAWIYHYELHWIILFIYWINNHYRTSDICNILNMKPAYQVVNNARFLPWYSEYFQALVVECVHVPPLSPNTGISGQVWYRHAAQIWCHRTYGPGYHGRYGPSLCCVTPWYTLQLLQIWSKLEVVT